MTVSRRPMLHRLLLSLIAAITLMLGMLMLGGGTALAQNRGTAQPAATAAPTPAQAREVIDILQNPQKRAQLIQTLQTIEKAAPAPKPKPPAKPAIVAPNSLGVQLLGNLSVWAAGIAAAAAETIGQLSDAPLLWRALMHTARDPAARAAVADAAWRIVLILAVAALAEAATRRALRRPMRTLAARAPAPGLGHSAWELLRRLPFALVRLVLDLIPVVVFAGVGNLLAGVVAGSAPATPLVALALVNAYAVARAIVCAGRMLASPAMPRLRLLPVGEDGAAAFMSWLRVITIVTLAGTALAQVALLLGLPQASHDALIRLTALVDAILLAAIVIANRGAVAAYIRGGAIAPPDAAEWRRWLAETWHYIALAVIFAVWLVSIGGVGHGGRGTLDFLLGTAAVLVGARLLAIVALGAVARVFSVDESVPGRRHAIGMRAARYHRIIRLIVSSVIAVMAALALLQLWGAHALSWFAPGRIGQHLVSALITIALAAAFAIVVWESANAAIDRQIDRLHDVEPARSARLRTLLPMMRTGLLVTIVIVVGATALSEVGVNIAPLLAGAGIVGIAVGFGAQTLVHDIITGMFILIENTIQVGDGVTVAGLSGTVEQLSIRTLRLRAGDGSLHIIPFSSVVTVTNNNRGIGNAAISVIVAADQDIDRVTAVLGTIGEELRADPSFAPMILGDLNIWGVDALNASGITLSGQIPCTVGGRMPVQREFNRRMLKRFAAEHIALGPTP